jgi:photosystem II stability/assembly factor-like uncharacterized protein
MCKRSWSSLLLTVVASTPAHATGSLDSATPADGALALSPVTFRIAARSTAGVDRVADGNYKSPTRSLSVSAGCADADGDGYGAYPATSTLFGCEQDGVDCDDSDPDINPGVAEICGDGIDNNCRNGIDESCGAPAAFDGWRPMPERSQGEFDRGEIGGRAEQYMQGGARCRGNPDIIYTSHDCGQNWRSDDGGATWGKPLNIGLSLSMGQSIEVDPVDCDRVIQVLDNAYDYRHTDSPGIYVSEDGGNHWQFAQAGPTLHSRRYEHNIAWAPSSVDATGARRWYVALYNESTEPGNANAGIYVSNDYGRTWTRGASLVGHNPVFEVQVSPTDQQSLLVASSLGLHSSTDGGQTLTRVSTWGTGAATSVAFDPASATTVYAVQRGGTNDGVYRATTAGGAFSRLTVGDTAQQAVLSDARRIFMHPTSGSIFYVLPESTSRTALRTENAGTTYTAVSFSLPDDVRAWRWGITFASDFGFVLMSATNSHDVVGQSIGAALYRSADGLVFENGSELFTGANCGGNTFSIAYDETAPERLAFGNQDIGMYYTDTGADWFYARSIPWAWVGPEVAWGNQQSLSFRPGSSTEVVSAVGDYFTKRLAHTSDNGQNWTLVTSASETGNYWRVGYHLYDSSVVYAGNRRSLDGGLHFSLLPVPAALNDSDMQVTDFCRAQPDVVYMAARSSGRILRSEDKGDTWALYGHAPGSIGPFDSLPTFAVDPVHCNNIYTLDSHGDLTRFDGTSWHSLGVLALAQAQAPAGYFLFVRSVMVDPTHPEIIYAGMAGSGTPALFRSVDGGATWQDISYNRFRDGASSINVSPLSGEVMVGGCSGTWILPPPYAANGGIYAKLPSRPSCFDGLKNGDEAGVDCGGRCAAPCGCVDADADGFGVGDCTGDLDCNDADANVHPGATESCNGVDDDCDGQVDETWPSLGASCTVGLGVCARTGVMICAPGGTDITCSAVPGPAGGGEICDGLADEDCDGTIDNGCPCSGGNRSCYGGPAWTQGVGICHAGTQACRAGVWGECVGQVLATNEVCSDGVDNDCDGAVDEAENGGCLPDASDLADDSSSDKHGPSPLVTASCSCMAGSPASAARLTCFGATLGLLAWIRRTRTRRGGGVA